MSINASGVRYGMLLGSTACMKQVYAIAQRAAQVAMPVLITGETGTGKDLIASEIHRRSARKDKPYVPLNTGTLSRELMLSELFGHVRGAFTGATESKTGRFQEADGGTLFLDEVSTMEDRVQVALLRAIQEGEYRPIGAKHDVRADVRLIAATNVNLEQAVARGEFRQDLLHRLQVISINVPPLRQRTRDIPRLARLFLDNVVEEYAFPEKRIGPEAMLALQKFPWPGNVRELKNAIAQAALFSDDSATITLEHLPQRIRSDADSDNNGAHKALTRIEDKESMPRAILEFTPRGALARPMDRDAFTIPLGLPIEEVQRLYVEQILRYCGHNKTRAAQLLGVSRKTLYDKLARWNGNAAP